MVTVFDVSKYIVDELGEISTWKLQKLVYYCQAWSLVWDERPLFGSSIEAWANGPPACRDLYSLHKGQYSAGPKYPSGNRKAQILMRLTTASGRRLISLFGTMAAWRGMSCVRLHI